MAPTFWGPYREVACKSCGNHWRVAAETVGPTEAAECTVCGQPVPLSSQVFPGEVVTISKIPADKRPARLDCVVFSDSTQTVTSHDPSSSRRAAWNCKRVWGLPDEELQVSEGELYINGELFQKSYDQLRQLASLVSCFDAQNASLASRSWVLVAPDHPSTSPTQFNGPIVIGAGQQIRFHHASPFVTGQSAVFDEYPQNLSTPRNLVEVNDLVFVFELDSGSSAVKPSSLHVSIQMEYGKQRYEHRFELQNEPDSNTIVAANSHRLMVAAWDGKVAVAKPNQQGTTQLDRALPANVNLQPLNPYASALEASDKTTFQLTSSTGCRILKASVYRDIHLRMDERDPSNKMPEKIKVPSSHYFLLGDNLPISQDSRNRLGMVSDEQILAVLHVP